MVHDRESLARFLYSRKHFAVMKGTVKHAAFMPARDLRTSVFRKDDLDDEDLRKLANQSARRATFKGYAELLASQVRSARPLDVVPETSFHELHADIVGWPQEREKQIELARLIAGRADLVLADPLPL